MNVYIVPTPCNSKGLDKRSVSSWRQVQGVGSFSLVSNSRDSLEPPQRRHPRSGASALVRTGEPQPSSGSIQDGGRSQMAAQGVWIGMEVQS